MSSVKETNQGGAVECRSCKGTGNCARCEGEGIDPAGNFKKCRRCEGTGVCPGCGGSGWVIIPIVHQS
jgi:hypothetical protein